MTDTFAASDLLPRLVTSECGELGSRQSLDCFCDFVGMGDIYYFLVTLSIAWLLDFVSTAPYLVICTSIVVSVRHSFHLYRKHFDDIFFYYARPYEVGDLIEFEFDPPSETCTRFRPERIWRVVNFHAYYTEIVSLKTGRLLFPSNKRLAERRILVWTRVPAVFHVMMQVAADAADGLLFLRELHDAIERFASENSTDWYPVTTFAAHTVTIEKKYKEYCFDIRHRETWLEFDHIVRNKIDLDLYCLYQVDEFNKRHAKQDALALLNVVGEKNNDGGDGNGDVNKENSHHKVDSAEKAKMDKKVGHGDKHDEKQKTAARLVNYRVFVA
ncbi:hypothetical protein FisN_14Lh094 [Fistulifera solaris]|uniref:Uncharacterized protein n=1 Tax=Fistulifera solaris TaxID=1519565 RepID=A0A1Z5J9C7_FISSO|nr:hypothetical protein FisN_14Lh094 [Fistulifera solaris]|eukprot:GAX10595.1 hypothetical protein FisN_14Lh094 [Fistulifera solaris]